MRSRNTDMVTPKHASEVLEALRYDHTNRGPGERWVCFDELRGVGYGREDMQRIDLWVMNVWQSGGLARTAYEVKISRTDFLKELANPLKRRRALLVSNQFYFAAPVGLIKPEEVPIECGLVEVAWDDYARYRDYVDGGRAYEAGWKTKETVPAPWRDNPPPTWAFFAAIARRIHREEAQL